MQFIFIYRNLCCAQTGTKGERHTLQSVGKSCTEEALQGRVMVVGAARRNAKLGIDWEEHIQCLHLIVSAVVHIQQFIKRSIKCQPHGFGGHFPKAIFWA